MEKDGKIWKWNKFKRKGGDKSGLALVLLPDAEFEPAASPDRERKNVCAYTPLNSKVY